MKEFIFILGFLFVFGFGFSHNLTIDFCGKEKSKPEKYSISTLIIASTIFPVILGSIAFDALDNGDTCRRMLNK
jgi:hypothetical protein